MRGNIAIYTAVHQPINDDGIVATGLHIAHDVAVNGTVIDEHIKVGRISQQTITEHRASVAAEDDAVIDDGVIPGSTPDPVVVGVGFGVNLVIANRAIVHHDILLGGQTAVTSRPDVACDGARIDNVIGELGTVNHANGLTTAIPVHAAISVCGRRAGCQCGRKHGHQADYKPNWEEDTQTLSHQ